MTFTLLSDTAEGHLFLTDYRAWVKYSACKWRDRMAGKSDEEKRIAWAAIPKDVKEELQRMKQEETQAAQVVELAGDLDAML